MDICLFAPALDCFVDVAFALGPLDTLLGGNNRFGLISRTCDEVDDRVDTAASGLGGSGESWMEFASLTRSTYMGGLDLITS